MAAAEYLVRPSALWRDVLPTAAHRWIVQQPAGVQAIDCAPLTPESASIEWLTNQRIALVRGAGDDCTEPDFAATASARGLTHVLVRRGSVAGRWFDRQPRPRGLALAAQFADADVFAVATPAPIVYTAGMSAFYSREYDATSTWRWMGPQASWIVVNSGDHPIVAGVDITMAAFRGTRRLGLLLDGREFETLTVEERRRVHRIGPLSLTPGQHELTFRPAEAPTTAGAVMNNGDPRALSVAFGGWDWTLEGARR
jgi:hypothetical protein